MPKQTFRLYALPPTEAVPYEHVGHFLEGHAPSDAREIDADEARAINEDVSARTTIHVAQPSSVAAQLSASVDLKPLFDKIEALSKTVITQAEALDAAAAKIEAQASDISKVRENTAKAIAQMTEGIGETKK